MPPIDMVCLGASAGGLQALLEILSVLPADLPATLFVVLHLPPDTAPVLPKILARKTDLAVVYAREGDPIQPGWVYVAPPDFHLLLERNGMILSRGPREHRVRPAIDPLFRSAARTYGARAAGVILSGSLSDGMLGLMAIKAHGGIAVVQDPEDALVGGMPRSALAGAAIDHVLPASEIGGLLRKLAMDRPAAAGPGREDMPSVGEPRTALIQQDIEAQEEGCRANSLSVYTCPDCGGVMWEMDDQGLVSFRCHVGHAYSIQSLLVQQAEALEDGLWHAIRVLREKAILSRQMLARHAHGLHPEVERRFREQAEAAEAHVKTLQDLVTNPVFSMAVDQAVAQQASPIEDPPLNQPVDIEPVSPVESEW